MTISLPCVINAFASIEKNKILPSGIGCAESGLRGDFFEAGIPAYSSAGGMYGDSAVLGDQSAAAGSGADGV